MIIDTQTMTARMTEHDIQTLRTIRDSADDTISLISDSVDNLIRLRLDECDETIMSTLNLLVAIKDEYNELKKIISNG